MDVSFEVARTASAQTLLTCNCLLPACCENAGAVRSEHVGLEATEKSTAHSFHAASYELLSSSSGEVNATPHHAGECATFGCSVDAQQHCCTVKEQRSTSHGGVSHMPGVFDLVSVPFHFLRNLHPSHEALRYLAMACTDGSVRVVDPSTLTDVVEPFTGIHAEMVTSCTPLFLRSAEAHFLCSAHTGAVVLYSLAERRVTHELEGHKFDAWCTAALPTSGWWTAPAPHASSDSDVDADAGDVVDSMTGGVLLASGGDDGLCKLYDVRCNSRRAIARMRFDAGVVSITPVLDTAGSSGSRNGGDAHAAPPAMATPYIIVGSYDESIQLLDVRAMRRPVAQRGGLGGGVWRTSRCLYPLWGSGAAAVADCEDSSLQLMQENARVPTTFGGEEGGYSASTSAGWVNMSNVLVLPLMQRGAALLPYDVRASAEEVFGDAPLQHFFAEDGEANAAALPSLTEKSLVYDTAVLRPLVRGGEEAAFVATASFYEKRIDLWSVRPARGA